MIVCVCDAFDFRTEVCFKMFLTRWKGRNFKNLSSVLALSTTDSLCHTLTALVLPMLVFAYTGLAASLLWSYCSIQVNYLFCVAVCGWGCSRCSTRTTTSGGCAVATQCTSMQSLIAHTTTQTYALAFCDFTCAGVHSSLSLLALALPVLVPLIPPLAGDSCNGLGGGARHSLF